MLRTAGHKKAFLLQRMLGNELSSWVLPFFEGRGMLVFLLQDSPYDFIAI